MTWFKVDDGFYAHPKTLSTTLSASGLWVRAGSWCGQQENDGVLPKPALPLLAPGMHHSTVKKLARELTEAGLWVDIPGGYAFHQWEQVQPLRSEKEAEREATRRRQAEWRQRRKEEKGE